MKHLLVTNDFPPKSGGIQSYLWELWRRLPSDDVTVLTTPYAGDEAWDREQPFRVERTRERVLFPTPSLVRRIDALADEVGAELVVLDPALPIGIAGRSLRHPYALVVHGAEVTVPRRLIGVDVVLRTVVRGARLTVAAGDYPRAEAEKVARTAIETIVIPPGVDSERFRPLDRAERDDTRRALGLPTDALVVLGISRLVPRKGFDVLLRAMAELAPEFPDAIVAIGGSGRDRNRLERIARETSAPARFVGRIDERMLAAAYGSADVFAMLCRNRWAGLEQEGFGIVFVEAAAAGVPQVAGASGGAADAVVSGETGFVVGDPHDVAVVASTLRRLLTDEALRARLGEAARQRAVRDFDYDVLAERLRVALEAVEGSLG